MARHVSFGRIGLMLTAFLMLTLIGVFATFAVPIPGARGLIAEARLAQALRAQALRAPDAGARHALLSVKPLLDRQDQASLAALRPDRAGFAQAMLLVSTAALDGGRVVAYRLRLLVIIIGVLGALFAVALLGIKEAP
jgi:hypothetical protein